MLYVNIKIGLFVKRINRFVATVKLLDTNEIVFVHVKNTGRLKELLYLDAEVYIQRIDNEKRKYSYDLIAVKKGNRIVNIDSMAPNSVVKEALLNCSIEDNIDFVKPEYTFGDSRFDFYYERNGIPHLMEVKGVTLESDGICLFPDAPTVRGTKHINGLVQAKKNGFNCTICFVIQMNGAKRMKPNWERDPDFCNAIRNAVENGINAISFDCNVKADEIVFNSFVPVII